jgi:hypothetical protein
VHPTCPPDLTTVLILEIALLWILVIPAVALVGLSVAQRVLAAGTERRRQVSTRARPQAHGRDHRLAPTFTRRPGHRLRPRRPTRSLSRR